MPSRPNILFLHSDEHSFRFLSARSRDRGGEPCRIAMLTGRHSHRCGAWSNASILSPHIPTSASHLQTQGYTTDPLYQPNIVSENPSRDFDDFPP